jgi:hypothetical protein
MIRHSADLFIWFYDLFSLLEILQTEVIHAGSGPVYKFHWKLSQIMFITKLSSQILQRIAGIGNYRIPKLCLKFYYSITNLMRSWTWRSLLGDQCHHTGGDSSYPTTLCHVILDPLWLQVVSSNYEFRLTRCSQTLVRLNQMEPLYKLRRPDDWHGRPRSSRPGVPTSPNR